MEQENQKNRKIEPTANGSVSFDSSSLYDSITYPDGGIPADKSGTKAREGKLDHLYDGIVYPDDKKAELPQKPAHRDKKETGPTLILNKRPKIDI